MARLPERNPGVATVAAGLFSSLPTLETLSPCAESAPEPSTTILRLLRETARRNRNTEFRPFYSIREVSNHFRVPPTTVSRIYARLKNEGLLRSAWGSKTFLEPAEINKHLRVRAIVGLPAALACFCTGREYRTFFLSMRDVLWRLGFATRLVFYDGRAAEAPEFAELLLSHKVDIVIWLQPGLKTKPIVRPLLDHGVRVITISDSSAPPGTHAYCLSRQRAIRDALIAWKREGIASVTVMGGRGQSPDLLVMIEGCLREAGMPHTVLNVAPWMPQDCLTALSQPRKSGIVFSSSETAVQLGSRYPAHFARLSNQAGVMMVDGLVDLPGDARPSVATDIIEVNWSSITRRIGADLISPTRLPKEKALIFEAKWIHHRGVNGSNMRQHERFWSSRPAKKVDLGKLLQECQNI